MPASEDNDYASRTGGQESYPFTDANTGTLDVLYALAALDRPNGAEVARYLSQDSDERDRSNIHGILERLREDGYTERGRTLTDQREYWHTLTEKGEQAVRADCRWRNTCLDALTDS